MDQKNWYSTGQSPPPNSQSSWKWKALEYKQRAETAEKKLAIAERQLRRQAFELTAELNRIRVSVDVISSLVGATAPVAERR